MTSQSSDVTEAARRAHPRGCLCHAVYHHSEATAGVLNGIQLFAPILKALSTLPPCCYLVTLTVPLGLEALPSLPSAGCLLVSPGCYPLKEVLLTPYLIFSPFSVTTCHHPHPLNVLTFQKALSDFPSWVIYSNVQNHSRVTLYFHVPHNICLSLKLILFIHLFSYELSVLTRDRAECLSKSSVFYPID